MNLKLNDYLNLNREGIFLGPEETEEEFEQRIRKLSTAIPLQHPLLTKEQWLAAHRITERIFDVKPHFVPAFYGNKKISLWEAGVTWDYQGRPVVQLRTQLALRRWIFVHQEEVLAHEATHATRMNFRETRFEEILCYETSRHFWRRQIGPLFRHPWEAALCVGAAGIAWVLGIFGIFSWALIIPWAPLLFFLLRLMCDRRIFTRCLDNMRPLLVQPEQALAVALRLSDVEILIFARASKKELMDFIQRQSEAELRWKVIASAYFKPG